MLRCIGLWIVGLGLLVFARAETSANRVPTAEERVLLEQALRNVAKDFNRWAYTETSVTYDDKGKQRGEVVIRYDPSKPYEEQFVPLRINGKPPTERELAKYRKRGEGARKRDENPDTKPRQTLGSSIEMEHATVASEDAQHLVFEIPLRAKDNERFPPEKFLVLARVNRDSRMLENVSVKLRESFRVKMIIKLKSGGASVDFDIVDPKYGPAMTSIQGGGTASVMFITLGAQVDVKRTDFRHVTPYADRFGVKIGELKALDF